MATIFRFTSKASEVSDVAVCYGLWDEQGKNRESLIREGMRELGIPDDDFQYHTEVTGKPFAMAGKRRVEISVSHYRTFMVVAVSVSQRIGIDIELKSRKVSNPLQKRIVVHDAELQIPTLQLWTLKEAFLKMTGTGLRMAMREVLVNRMDKHLFSASSSDQMNKAEIVSFVWREYQISLAVSVEN